MLSNNFKVHVKECMDLVKSIVVKIENNIETNNHYLRLMGYSVPSEEDNIPNYKRQWKWYMNISGTYHASNEAMTVISSDTRQPISFDRVTLLSHPLTRAEHQRGRGARKALERKYPDNALLIEGIINPIDIDEAINAEDFSILGYNKTLLMSNETNVIPKLQTWVFKLQYRFFFPDMNITDKLYLSVFTAYLYMFMVIEVINIRQENTYTNNVGQWHLWNYLGSYYDLSKYRDFLTTNQAMWLYRNIREIRDNAGTTRVLDDLVNIFLKEGKLDTSRFDRIKLEETLYQDGKVTPKFNKVDYNDINLDIDPASILTSAEMLYKTRFRGVNNFINLEKNTKILDEGILNSPIVAVPTNQYEVKQADGLVDNDLPNNENKLKYWTYLASLNKYNTPLTIKIPNAGSVILSTKDTLILMIYTANRYLGLSDADICRTNWKLNESDPNYKTCGVVPKIQLYDVIPQIYPVIGEIQKHLVDGDIEADNFINAFMANLMPLRDVDDLAELEVFAQEVSVQEQRQKALKKWAHTPLGVAIVDKAMSVLYTDVEVDFYPDTTWVDWKSTLNFSLDGLSIEEYGQISLECLKVGAGIQSISSGLPSTQRAMIEVVDLLTSYNVIFTQGAGQNNSIMNERHSFKPYDYLNSIKTTFQLPHTSMYPVQLGGGYDVDIKWIYEINSDRYGYQEGENYTSTKDIYDIEISANDVTDLDKNETYVYEVSHGHLSINDFNFTIT